MNGVLKRFPLGPVLATLGVIAAGLLIVSLTTITRVHSSNLANGASQTRWYYLGFQVRRIDTRAAIGPRSTDPNAWDGSGGWKPLTGARINMGESAWSVFRDLAVTIECLEVSEAERVRVLGEFGDLLVQQRHCEVWVEWTPKEWDLVRIRDKGSGAVVLTFQVDANSGP